MNLILIDYRLPVLVFIALLTLVCIIVIQWIEIRRYKWSFNYWRERWFEKYHEVYRLQREVYKLTHQDD